MPMAEARKKTFVRIYKDRFGIKIHIKTVLLFTDRIAAKTENQGAKKVV